uniref:DUF7713 domain-containing protein n=1 Tax=Caballeronia cordobensis TaxID=1353886 RepID=UPI001F1D4E7A|nr:hypothetical protein [Caballeronia cordobensis]
MAQFADLHGFEHPSFTPLRLRDVDDNHHEFHFCGLLLGDQLSLEAFELAGDDEAAGYRFQILGEADAEPSALLGQLIQKMKRALALKHLQADAGRLQIANTTVRGRVEWNGDENARQPCTIIDGQRIKWNDLGAMLLAFEGWQFRLEMLDPSDEA